MGYLIEIILTRLTQFLKPLGRKELIDFCILTHPNPIQPERRNDAEIGLRPGGLPGEGGGPMTDNQALAIVKQLERIADALESIDETLPAGGDPHG